MKKRVCSVVAVMLTLAMILTGCGFSVGDVQPKEDFKSLFPDKAKTMGNAYAATNMGYDFSLDDGSGQMKVYVDTSEGHQFEVIYKPAGFKIKDADGNDVLYAACMDKEQFASYTADCTEVKTINGREFLYKYNEGDGSEDCFSYMADCGLDCGLALEVHDGNTDCFGLVAFRGEAIDGASSDVRDYQGVPSDDTDVSVTDDVTGLGDDIDGGVDAGTAGEMDVNLSGLDAETEKILQSLESDYGRVKWGVRYSLSDDLPGIVISVSECKVFDEYELIVAVTNLYDRDFGFSGQAAAKDANDNILGDTYIFSSCIGSGNTIISTISCGDGIPDGRISWTDVSIDDPMDTFIPWESDVRITGNPSDGYVNVDYELYASSGKAFRGENVVVFLLDADGYVVGIGSDYADEAGAGEKYSSSMSIYGDEEYLKTTKGYAMFANPTAIE